MPAYIYMSVEGIYKNDKSRLVAVQSQEGFELSETAKAELIARLNHEVFPEVSKFRNAKCEMRVQSSQSMKPMVTRIYRVSAKDMSLESIQQMVMKMFASVSRELKK